MDAPEQNNLETQYTEATNSLEQDHVTPFVLFGAVATKDATTASQLDVSAGVAFVRQTDQTLRRRAFGAMNYSAVGNPSTTLYLDLNPDGSWSWGTAHSGVANHLTICSVTTDASGNILTITDARTLATTLFPSAVGALSVPGRLGVGSIAGPLNAQAPQPSASYQGVVFGGVTSVVGGLVGSADAALSFNGTTGTIALPVAAAPNTGNGVWSVECWFNVSAYPASGFATLLAFGSIAAKSEALLYLNTSGQLTIDTDAGPAVVGSAAVSKNVWHHAVATWSGAGGALTLYLDGVQIGQITGQPALTIGTAYFSLGARNSANNYVTGALDEVAVYSGVLSAAQVTTHYTLGAMGPTSPTTTYASTILADLPKAYWRLDENPARGVVYAVATGGEHIPAIAADGSMNPIAIASVGNQASVGQFGVPVVVAQTVPPVHVTDTSFLNRLSYTTPADGLYRLSLHISMGNSSSAAVKANVNYTEASLGLGVTRVYFTWLGDPNVLLNGSNIVGNNQGIGTFPITVYAKGGTSLVINYSDPSGVPNDYVSCMIERLS